MPADVEVSRVVLARIIHDQRRHLCVAEHGNEVVGSAELIVIEGLTHGAMPWAVVENVIVSRETRGRGAGTALLEHLLNLARAMGAIRSSSTPENSGRMLTACTGGSVSGPSREGFKLYFDDTRLNLDNELPESP